MAIPRSFVIFSGSNDRAVLAFLRAIEGCEQTPCIVARTKADHVLRTRHAKHVVFVRDTPVLDLDTFSRSIAAARDRKGNHELIILPSSEYFNAFLLEHRIEIESMGCKIPLPVAGTYAELTNKKSSTLLFLQNGCTVPLEFDCPEAAPLPLIAKPRQNIDAGGSSLYPIFLSSRKDFLDFASSQDVSEFFFQEHVHGESHYLLFHISQLGQTVSWSQQNLLQQPDGKSMLLAKPSSFHLTSLAEHMTTLLRKRGFTGLGMIEVIRDRERTVFIEMNPRIWGPIQFCQDQGVPILSAFIGELLHGDASYYLNGVTPRRSKDRLYFWFGGLLQTWLSGQRPTWHAPPIPFWRLLLQGLRNDVYLRRDSWRCFLRELALPTTRSFRRE